MNTAVDEPCQDDSGPPNTESIPQYSEISFSFDDEAGLVYAVLTPCTDARLLPVRELTRLLDVAGYAKYYVSPAHLEAIIQKIEEGFEGRLPVAQRLDAKCSVLISSDKLQAFIDTEPPRGGKSLDEQQITDALRAEGVSEKCWDNQEIANAAQRPFVSDFCVARAIPPMPGENARFEALVDPKLSQAPKIDESGSADLHEIYEFLFVKKGEPLMRRFPAVSGKPGINVVGEKIEPPAVDDSSFAKKIEGSEASPEDSDLLIATIDGHPKIQSCSVEVEPALVVKQVNLTTGNIHFDGAVEVRGDVNSGFMVEASGDVCIRGALIKSTVKCGGNLQVCGGIIGEEETKSEVEESAKAQNNQDKSSQEKAEADQALDDGRIEVGGDLSAKFISGTNIQAGGTVDVREYILHCQVTAKGAIQVGQSGGKGAIIGGLCHTDIGLQANLLGSTAYVPTKISAGYKDDFKAEYERKSKLREKRNFEKNQLIKILKRMNASTKPDAVGRVVLDKAKKVRNTIEAIHKMVEGLDAELAGLREKIQSKKPAFIETKKLLYPNVSISIEGDTVITQREHNATLLERGNDEFLNIVKG